MTLQVALRHRFPGAQMDMAFEGPSSGITVLFGPSGAGKSTVIAAVAGLLRPDFARITLDGRVLGDTDVGVWLPPERRRVGLVFQDARLFPHMSVATNLRYGQRRAPPGPIGFDDVVDLLGIAPLLARRPRTLSGGERQRVAIGRALLAQPLLLLLDEPLANLDAARKAEILPYLARLKTALKLPILYVTHAIEEMTRLADTVVLIEHGCVVASGPMAQIAARGDVPLAVRDDAGAVVDVVVAGHDQARQLTRLDASGTTILVPLVAQSPGSKLRLRVPAREVILAREAPAAISVQNVLPAIVRAMTQDAPRHAVLVEVMAGRLPLLARITPDAAARLALQPGSDVIVMFKSVGIELTGTQTSMTT
jgi:molybdate transport system ATP-binding protein